jgi:hypothetical protein
MNGLRVKSITLLDIECFLIDFSPSSKSYNLKRSLKNSIEWVCLDLTSTFLWQRIIYSTDNETVHV